MRPRAGSKAGKQANLGSSKDSGAHLLQVGLQQQDELRQLLLRELHVLQHTPPVPRIQFVDCRQGSDGAGAVAGAGTVNGMRGVGTGAGRGVRTVAVAAGVAGQGLPADGRWCWQFGGLPLPASVWWHVVWATTFGLAALLLLPVPTTLPASNLGCPCQAWRASAGHTPAG